MVGMGTFSDSRLKNSANFPGGRGRQRPDMIADNLAALHFYQLAIPGPMPPKGFFNKEAATIVCCVRSAGRHEPSTESLFERIANGGLRNLI